MVPEMTPSLIPPLSKFILDACCGGRMFWFNKQHPNAIYMDIREAEKGHIGHGFNPNHEVKPDVLMDFRSMRWANNTFRLVVFDPPHGIHLQETSILRKKYGCLDDKTWQQDLQQGFNECYRVLMDYGVLIFKWAEIDVKLGEILKLFPVQPLFGHTTGSRSQTHWMCYIKIPEKC